MSPQLSGESSIRLRTRYQDRIKIKRRVDNLSCSKPMEMHASDERRPNTRPSWFKPGEVWGGDEEDNPLIGDTLGLHVKRLFRKRLECRNHACDNLVGSKITLRKVVLVFLALLTLYVLEIALSSLGLLVCQITSVGISRRRR